MFSRTVLAFASLCLSSHFPVLQAGEQDLGWTSVFPPTPSSFPFQPQVHILPSVPWQEADTGQLVSLQREAALGSSSPGQNPRTSGALRIPHRSSPFP